VTLKELLNERPSSFMNLRRSARAFRWICFLFVDLVVSILSNMSSTIETKGVTSKKRGDMTFDSMFWRTLHIGMDEAFDPYNLGNGHDFWAGASPDRDLSSSFSEMYFLRDEVRMS